MAMSLTGSRSQILLQACSIPDLGCPIIRRSNEKSMIRSYNDPINSGAVFSEDGNQSTFWLPYFVSVVTTSLFDWLARVNFLDVWPKVEQVCWIVLHKNIIQQLQDYGVVASI